MTRIPPSKVMTVDDCAADDDDAPLDGEAEEIPLGDKVTTMPPGSVVPTLV